MSGDRVTTWTKVWALPKLTIYTPADRRPGFIWNRYGDLNGSGGVVIGCAVVLRGQCYSLTWAKPVSHVERVTR